MRLRVEPYPEREVPPHKKRGGNKKPWAVQIKWKQDGGLLAKIFEDWTNCGRYKTKAQAEQAIEQRKKQHRNYQEFRLLEL